MLGLKGLVSVIPEMYHMLMQDLSRLVQTCLDLIESWGWWWGGGGGGVVGGFSKNLVKPWA